MRMVTFFVGAIVKNNKHKICSVCSQKKVSDQDFYKCQGKYRSECKVCTIRKNVRYQRRAKVWLKRIVDVDERRAYMSDYYAKNKAKYAEYRRKFKETHPEYHKEYYRMRLNEKK